MNSHCETGRVVESEILTLWSLSEDYVYFENIFHYTQKDSIKKKSNYSPVYNGL